VGVAFPNTPFRGAELVGMPMSDEIANLDRKTQRSEAMRRLGLDESLPTVIVTGGSLGALTLNKAVEANIDALADWGFQVLHITGKGKAILDEQGNPRTAKNYHQMEFCTSMQDVYAAADLLVVRSGAATVSEVAAVGVPAVFVPLPHGNGEQSLNIRPLLEEGAARLVEDQEATAERDAEFARLDEEIESLENQRADLAGTIEAVLLADYEAVCTSTGGLGAVALRGRIIEGGAVEISPQELARIVAAPQDEVIHAEENDVIVVRMDI